MPTVTAAMVAAGRTVAEPRLAPDGGRLAFVAVEQGRGRLVVVDQPHGPEVVVTTEPAPAGARSLGGGVFGWTPDGDALVYADRDGRLWRQPAVGGPPGLVLEVTAADGVASPVVAPTGDRVAYVVDTRHVEVVALGGTTSPLRLSVGADFAIDPTWSPDATTVAWHEWDVPAMPWDGSRIVVAAADGSAPPRPVAGGDGVQVQQPRFSPDGRALAYLSDEDGWLNLTVLDLGDGSTHRLAERREHGGPTWGPGQRSFAWAPDSASIVVTRNEDGFGALVRWDLAGPPRPVARAVHGGLSWEGDRLAAVRTGARTPTQLVVYDGADPACRRTVAVGPVALGAAPLPEPEVVRWPADDGVEIPGRLYRPPGVDAPGLLCWVHGGPTDQWPVDFRPRLTYWLDRGWAVLVPDHRGSTGHGRAFTQAMTGRWGELDVADVAAGIRAAVERGWCDPRRIVAMGASAGGFTVLHLLARHPELCAAGVDLYGVTDVLGLTEVDHRYEAHYPHTLVGPLPAARATYDDRSPLRHATAIVAPLLILQGTDDAVVPPAQSQALAAALEAAGRVVELHLYDGEGHGWGRPETVVDELERTEDFLRRHVPGRERP